MVRFAHRLRKFSHPHMPSYRHARYGNGFAVLRFATALRVPAAARGGALDVSGRGTSRPRFARVRSGLRPASNREQISCLRESVDSCAKDRP